MHPKNLSPHLHFLLFIFFLIFSITPSFSRQIQTQTQPKTQILDISSSQSLAAAALSYSLPAVGSADVSPGNGISIHLHSRDFLPTAAHSHVDYKSLTLSRLRRDSVRVAAISSRISLAIDGISHSDLKPMAEDALAASAAEIEGPVVSGINQGSGEYFSRVGIGSPAKQVYMVLDTGSDVTWVQCAPCADCYQQSDPIYDPAASSSYSALSCNSPRCQSLDTSACRNATGACLYEVAYGDGSYTVGDFATETLTLGSSAPVPNVAFGCGHDNEGLFVGAAGLLALGGGSLSFPAQVSATSFSYCLVDRDSNAASTLQLGDGGSGYGGDGEVTAPLVRSKKTATFYYVAMSGISVGGTMLSIPSSAFEMDEAGSGGVIVDSGTAVTRLQQAAHDALRDAFTAGTSSLPRASAVSLFDTCYALGSRTSVEVPTVSLHFVGGGELKLPAKNYLIPVDGSGTYCLAFAPTNAPVSIIGNVQQQGIRVGFNVEKGVVGFSGNKC